MGNQQQQQHGNQNQSMGMNGGGANNPFGILNDGMANGQNQNNPFGIINNAGNNGPNPAANPFGILGMEPTKPADSGMGGFPQPSANPFGGPPAQSNNPFGGSPFAPTPSPFGNPAQSSNDPFGSITGGSPFGGMPPQQSIDLFNSSPPPSAAPAPAPAPASAAPVNITVNERFRVAPPCGHLALADCLNGFKQDYTAFKSPPLSSYGHDSGMYTCIKDSLSADEQRLMFYMARDQGGNFEPVQREIAQKMKELEDRMKEINAKPFLLLGPGWKKYYQEQPNGAQPPVQTVQESSPGKPAPATAPTTSNSGPVALPGGVKPAWSFTNEEAEAIFRSPAFEFGKIPEIAPTGDYR
jgi:hypothetical protein